MLNVDDYKNIINDTLFNNEIINRELYLKCNPVISDLPYDLRTTDIDELKERMDAIEGEIDSRQKILDKAEYRIGVKSRDIDKISKRMAKQGNNMEKSIDDINKESDKIVKNINKLEDKLKKLDLSDPSDKSLRDSLMGKLESLKKAHNKFFDMDLTPNNLTTYRGELGTLEASGVRLHNTLTDMFNGGMISKTDLNNGDISKNIARIDKQINKFEKNSNDMKKDGQKMTDNFNDINYIARESKTVRTSIDALDDDLDRTLNRYLDLGGDRSVKPGFSQSGHGHKIPEFIDEMNKLQKELGKTYPYAFA